ncbi:minor capsid protein [Lysobacter enzymogenes]|uniref:phage head morphogenesis protein n=1 Tax=Lysobacter enzymogenes TaxID=69 RepID=UPI001A96C55C|nr:minor capsid protein [Lysobacter enzymogenes]QQP97928.1 minor capsid protein [Lysobacter enzymogenes]
MPALINESIRLQVLLERVKAGEDQKVDEFLRSVDRDLRERLTRADVSPGQRSRIEALLREVRSSLSVLYDRQSSAYLGRLEELGQLVADTEGKSVAAALEGVRVETPSPEVLRVAVNSTPLSVRGAGGGMLLDSFVSKWGEADVGRIEGVIRRGYFEGRTTDQIVRDLRGTKAANYADGELAVSRRHARTVVHTSVQHMASVARMETMKANSDILEGYRWVSTLDGKTSEICQSLDGRVFQFGEGPVPPAHPNCRSTIVPVTKSFRSLGLDVDEMPPSTRASEDGQVSGSLTYFQWLKTQPADFVDEALGPTRAAVFLRGGISADEFAALQLGKNFQPLTIEQMRQAAPKVFAQAGV